MSNFISSSNKFFNKSKERTFCIMGQQVNVKCENDNKILFLDKPIIN